MNRKNQKKVGELTSKPYIAPVNTERIVNNIKTIGEMRRDTFKP